MKFQKYNCTMLHSDRLYFIESNFSCFTLRYFCSATKLQCC